MCLPGKLQLWLAFFLSPRTFLQINKNFRDRSLTWSLDDLALPKILGDLDRRIQFVPLFLLPSFVCLGCKNSVTVSCYVCRSHTYNRAFYWQLFCKPHGPWNTIPTEIWDPSPLLTQKYTGPPEIREFIKEKKNSNYCLFSHSIRLEVRENVGCISHVNGNETAVSGSFSLKTRGSNSSDIYKVQA